MAEDVRDTGYVPAPAGVRDPGGNNPTTAANPSTTQIRRYEPRWLKPTMFGVMNWRQVEMGLTAIQANALYDWLSKIDTQANVRRYSFGNFGQSMLRQARERVSTQIPATPSDPVVSQPPPDPNANTQAENEAINNPATGKPEPRDEYVPPLPATGTTRVVNGVEEVFVNGGWRPRVMNAGPQTPYVGSGDTAAPNVNAGPVVTPVVNPNNANANADPMGNQAVKPMNNLVEGADYVWNPNGRGRGVGQWEDRMMPVPNPTVTPDLPDEPPSVDWKSYLPDKWKGLANYGKANPNWWKSYFDYDKTQRRFTPRKNHASTILGLTAFTVPQSGGQTGPYVAKPNTSKVMH